MQQKIEEQKEMDSALLNANQCSEALEEILREVRVTGDTSREMFERVNTANEQCKVAMERYLNAYSVYYSSTGD